MTIKAGDKLPSVNFKKLDADGLSDISSESYCKGRKVALFSVPGAFTPTCSMQQCRAVSTTRPPSRPRA